MMRCTFQWFSWNWYFLPTIAYIPRDTMENDSFFSEIFVAFLCVKFTMEWE